MMRIPFLPAAPQGLCARAADIADSPAVSMLHREDFVRPWTDGEFAALLEQDTVFGYAARETGQGAKPPGRLRAGAAGGRRRRDPDRRGGALPSPPGLGWQLMDAVLRELHAQRAEALFLEVDETNVAAIALYRRLGFREVGKRANITVARAGPTGALVMRRDLR